MASMSPASSADRVDVSPRADDVSPRSTASPKNVAFELLIVDSPQYRARLPMRVQIYPHDTTDSIVTTVKNFYGLYSGPTGSKGVSFEDSDGNTLIARYENFSNNMRVYVRVFEEYPAEPVAYGAHNHHQAYAASAPPGAGGHQPFGPADAYNGHSPPAHGSLQSPPQVPRPLSRNERHRSRSPGGYSSDEGASSARLKDHLGNTDISVENIVEGGRRKRAKFESSELPLFAPPQMPAATSNPSVSPARRAESHRPPMGFVHPGHNPFTNPRSMHASSQHGYSSSMNGHGYSTPHGVDHRRSRSSAGIVGLPMGGAILPTPDPTVGSCVSEEDKDVALQLMRLGDMSNVSHGRTSASTLDDAFSGKAEVASSTGATSDSESDSGDDADFDVGQPPARRQKLLDGSAGAVARTPEARSALPTSSTLSIDRQGGSNGKPKAASAKPKASKPKPSTAKTAKANGKMTTPGMPMSPASAPASRKPSIVGASPMMMAVVDGAAAVAATPGDDQPDLSTKPRCQRCRKSKKGCDRQRPCGRCRDAGLSAEQCISEDEGNGRKGRYGRHMGVPIKATSAAGPTAMTPGHAEPSPAPPMGMPAPVAVQSGAGVAAGPGLLPAAHISMSVDKKKRKR